VWFGVARRPFAFASPVDGEFALLLVVVADDVTDEEQSELSQQFVRAGCRYAVCFGPTSSSWDDSIDMVSVMDRVDGRDPPFVMTSWHDDESVDEAVAFFAQHSRIDDELPRDFVVFMLGGTDRECAEVREAVTRQFGWIG